MVDAKKSAYLNRLNSCTKPVLNTAATTPVATQPAAVVQTCAAANTNLGLGAHACPNNCNGNGQCLINGCRCNLGWTGPLCTISLSTFGIPISETVNGRVGTTQTLGPQAPVVPTNTQFGAQTGFGGNQFGAPQQQFTNTGFNGQQQFTNTGFNGQQQFTNTGFNGQSQFNNGFNGQQQQFNTGFNGQQQSFNNGFNGQSQFGQQQQFNNGFSNNQFGGQQQQFNNGFSNNQFGGQQQQFNNGFGGSQFE